jgi:hypothetical protein
MLISLDFHLKSEDRHILVAIVTNLWNRGLGFRLWTLGFRLWTLGFRLWTLGFRGLVNSGLVNSGLGV